MARRRTPPPPRSRLLAALATALTVLALAVGLAGVSTAPAAATTADAASLAKANLGRTAGTCAFTPTHNTLGGSQYENSCVGYAGVPEYWCADFAKWTWRHSGLDVSGLTAAAQSFYVYGQDHGTLTSTPRAGYAIVFNSSAGGWAHHVGIITSVNSDGSISVANGDWGGAGGKGEAYFAKSSSVKATTISARSTWIGSWASTMNYYIKAIVAPSGSTGSAPPPDSGNPYSAAGICGSGYGVVDSQKVSGATVFLLYDGGSGYNCVVTLADADKGAVSMNATLAVQGGSSGSDPGSYHWYAGPVRFKAPDSCVKWGGQYRTASYTSGWEHCGSGPATPPAVENSYTPTQVCGSGYSVIDHHKLSGATVYLLYNGGTGRNCVTTLADSVGSAVSMNATLTVQNGSSVSDPGTYASYAGPVSLYAPNSCVKWGGTYRSSSWTSAYGHCGGGSSTSASNPYTATGVCGSGYSVIDSHNLGAATTYLLYKATTGYNCVVTLVHSGNGSVGLNARLYVDNGTSRSNPGLFQWYAGPVRLHAAGHCVRFGGNYESTSWTSSWGHCG